MNLEKIKIQLARTKAELSEIADALGVEPQEDSTFAIAAELLSRCEEVAKIVQSTPSDCPMCGYVYGATSHNRKLILDVLKN